MWQGWEWLGASESLTREGASSAYTSMPFQLLSTHLGHMTLIFSLTIMSISPCPQIFKTFKKNLALYFGELHHQGTPSLIPTKVEDRKGPLAKSKERGPWGLNCTPRS